MGDLALALPLGLVIGLSIGALGGGGSILAVPALVHLFGQDALTATTGSLVVVGVTALVGAVPHQRAGRVRVVRGLVFGALGSGGAVAGSWLSAGVPDAVLLAGFAVLMLVVAALMTVRRRRASRVGSGGAAPDGPGPGTGARHVVLLLVTASGVGLLTGFFGVGGGFAVVPALVLALGLSMPVAVGTSLVVIAVNSAVALAARLARAGDLDWPLLGVFTVAAVAGSLLGSRVVGRLSPARLNLAFTVLLVAVALFMATRSILDLTT